MDISYKEIYAMNKEEARKQIVNSYLATSLICIMSKNFWKRREVRNTSITYFI
jgi:hypothetical protein